jgi:lipopolysaccharide/colanic/teichoic acid biosynthesis glycosyltransferase
MENIGLIAQLRTGHNRPSGSVDSSDRFSEISLRRQPDPDAMFCARYISAWCMSKRKRCFDLSLGLIALTALSPLMVLIAFLIRLTSQGPALFRQDRVGLHQQTFVIFKFRTMEDRRDLLGGASTVTRHRDPRMTKVGVLLRSLKFDELPQLLNVIRGDMSFVGPRPKVAQHENLRMLCRPGITGAATIKFSHEDGLLKNVPEEMVERYMVTVLNPEKCRLDVQYIETAGFRVDLAILAHTIFKLSSRSPSGNSAAPDRFLMAMSAINQLHRMAPDSFVDGEFATSHTQRSA